MTRILIFISCLTLGTSAFGQRWELQWSDEFDEATLDTTTWTHWIGTAFNNELQYYTDRPENSYVQDGILYLVAQTEAFQGQDYTSARIESKNAADFQYGRMEIRAKLPAGRGLWPAIWMLPTDERYGGWPYSGEIDIMEFRGNEPTIVHGTVHYSTRAFPGSGNPVADRGFLGGSLTLDEGTFASDFRVFSVEWTPDEIQWFVDDVPYFRITPETIDAAIYPFRERFHFILNVAVGGDFLPNPLPGTVFEEAMEVDYVRVYQDANQVPRVTVALDNDVVESGADVTLMVEAVDDDGTVEQVNFFLNGDSLATVATLPFSYTWTNAVDGCHVVTARAYDNDGGVSELSPADTVTVGTGCAKRSFNDAPFSLPGVVPLVEYDYGGQNVSYFDSTPLENLGNATGNTFRPHEGVDLESVAAEPGAHAIAFVEDGEWFEYTVEVAESGIYNVELLAARERSASGVTVEVDGALWTRFLRLPMLEADGRFASKINEGLALEAGSHVMRVIADVGGVKLFRLRVADPQSTDITDADLPAEFGFRSAYPNPFSSQTQLSFTLAEPASVILQVYDALGRPVQTLLDETRLAGTHHIPFTATHLAPGVYTAVLHTPTRIQTRSLIRF